jgi:hypothetical protein
MTMSALLTVLYPPAVRERWGPEISGAVAESGVRSWPDTVASAGRLWLHPSDWPETADGQTRRVVAVAVFAVAAVTALLVRAGQPATALTADPRHPAASAWLAPILLGICLATAPPPLRWPVVRRLAGQAARTLAAPGAAGLALLLVARSGLVDHPTGPARAALIAYYWATLGFVAYRLCALTVRLGRLTAVPSIRRLHASLMLLGTGLALAAGQNLVADPHTGALPLTVALAVLAGATLRAGHDLNRGRIPASRGR